jgi:hypothetical protein
MTACRDLQQERSQLVGQSPVAGVLRGFADDIQGQFQQPIFWSIWQEDVVPNLKVVLTAQRLAHLSSNVQLPAQEALLFLYTLVVETYATFDQVIQRL